MGTFGVSPFLATVPGVSDPFVSGGLGIFRGGSLNEPVCIQRGDVAPSVCLTQVAIQACWPKAASAEGKRDPRSHP